MQWTIDRGVTMMRLLHYSSAPIEALHPIAPSAGEQMKPRGLWVSVEGEDDWESWCKDEQFGLEQLAVPHEVTLKPTANILHISDADAIFDLGREYGMSLPLPWIGRDQVYRLDWPRLATHWQGLIISPYQWSCRLDDRCFWYYGWDCASGCLWDVDAIASITAIEREAI